MKNIKLILLCALALLPAGAGEISAAQRQKERRPSPLAASMREVRRTPSAATRAAFNEFVKKQGKGWKVRYSPRTALPEAVTGGRTSRYPGTPEQAALAFFEENKALLKVEPSALRLVLKRDFMGVTHLQYQQYKDGVPVEFSYARVHVSADGEVSGYQGRFEPGLQLNTVPAVSEQAAVMAARADLGRQLSVSRTELVIYPDEASGSLKLAWKVRGRAGGLWVYYIDAADGSVLYKYDDLRYACTGSWNTYGTSTGKVFAVSPLPGYNAPDSMNVTEDLWTAPVAAALRDQYFWAGSYSSMTVTNAAGDYCLQQNGKVFSSLKGPYFAVTNYRGASAHYDNGGGTWYPVANSVQSPHPYANSQAYNYTVTIPDSWTGSGYAFAKAMPRFTSFSAGALDMYGSVNDADQVSVKTNSGSTLGAYIGTRSAPFYGAAVENPSYGVTLESDGSGTSSGFIIDISSYLVLTNSPGVSSNPGSPFWSTTTAGMYWDTSLGGTNALSEVNAFYHLNAIRRYFDPLNINTAGGAAVDLSAQVPVMVHAAGNPDSLTNCATGCRGMLNAYYDLEKGHILLGDGMMDYLNKYRSFALDGTIVRHEYVHLLIDKIYPIINFGEFGAISEGVADYFSLASFWREGYGTQRTLGNFVGAGEGSARDISGSGQPTAKRIFSTDPVNNNWYGEVHEDGLLLSQALYELRNSTPSTVTDLGAFSAGTFAGLSRADTLAFAALFYFPDNFTNFYDAMRDACDQFNLRWSGQCTAAMKAKIDTAFAAHGIGAAGLGGDSLETSASSAMCDNNNGPECASDISSAGSLTATVYPLGDVDYYSLPLSAGNFSAELALPMSNTDGIYYAYSMFLFDSNREYVTEAGPAVYGTGSDACPDSGQCYTLNRTVKLNYTVPPGGGRYYLIVAAAPNQYYGNSEANSDRPYTLTLNRTPHGSAAARVYSASFDNDELSFDVPYPYFSMLGSVSSATAAGGLYPVGAQTGAELFFEYAQLRDHNFQPIALTRTNVAGSYLSHVTSAFNAGTGNLDAYGRRQISGRVKLQPGFAARYPGFGTVYLEVFGRNHLGHVLSLGVSNALNLTANRSEVTAYNNIIAEGGAAILKYEVLSSGNLSVKVYTQAGSLVKTVYDGSVPAGKGTLEWDGTNSSGGKAASGIYFVKTKGPGVDKVVKIAVIR